ncbi:MAG: RNAseH domain-containing protein [Dolichospermum sp. DEX182a]|nr:RNAseH domain-containing protein [Dolichospermum sp. DEX182a]
MNTKQYISIGQKTIDSLFLALTIPDNIEPFTINSYTLSWTLEALAEFELIKSSTSEKNKNLPYASLRGLLQIYFDNIAYLDSRICLDYTKITTENYIKPFAYLSEGNNELITKNIRPALNEWITNYLRPYVKNNKSNSNIVDALDQLFQENKLIKVKPIDSQLLPWKWSGTGTTQGSYGYSYKDLVEFIARQIAGKEIFQKCGTMKRVISSNPGGGQAELMTIPISIKEKEGKFSLVIKLEIVTFPSVHQPVLRIDVSKRRWVYNLTKARYGLGNINGFIFSENYPDRAFQYQLSCEENQDKKWIWNIDNTFEILSQKLNIPLTVKSGEDIALGKASTQENQVMLTFRNGLQKNYNVQDGVPEIDKLEAYKAISNILTPIGFIPFQDYQPVKACHSSNDSDEGMINHITLLGGILESLDNNDFSTFTPEYFSKLTDDEKNSLLKQYFDITLQDIYTQTKGIEYNKGKKLPYQIPKLQATIKANNEALERLYPHEPLQLIIFYEEHLQTDVNFVKNIAQITLGSRFNIQLQRLPKNVHGAKKTLPGNNLKAKERSKLRIEEWKKITEQLKNLNQRTFCLILARKWYDKQLDDIINKPSTRQALASLAGSAVQFLLPIEKTLKGSLLNLENYFHQVQAALKDLISAHSGRIDNIQEKVNTYLKNIPPGKRPKEIIGVTIVRKQRGRVRGHIGQTYLLIATRLNVETGICELCCAYDKNNKEDPKWYKFADGIAFVSRISPIKLASDKQTAKNRFTEFLNQMISESVNNGNNPVVLIDSSNCVQLCPWLADVRITTHNIELNNQYQKMEDNWKGARIMRIRQDLAPGFIEEKVRQYAETSLEDNRTKEELTCDYIIPSATSPQKRLFKVTTTSNTGCVTYLSIGKKTLHQKQRGQSCYRETEIHKVIKDDNKQNMKNKADLEICEMTRKPVFIDKYPTPNPLEIVVTLRQEEDNSDDLAAFVESLRYGFGHYKEWSTLPAPLFFERVVRDYISEFSIIDDEELETEDTEAPKQLSLFD